MRSDDIIVNLKSIIGGLLTSNEQNDITETTFQIQIVNIPRGWGRNKIINLSKDTYTKRRQVLLKLKMMIIYVVRELLKIQKDLALKLCNTLKEYNEKGFTLDDIKNVEKLLDIQINIICAESLNALIYKGEDKETKIYLYKNGDHFDIITSMVGFYGSSYYCEKCDKAYNNKNGHICVKDKNVCKLCMRPEHLGSTKNKIYCQNCSRYCYNQECLDDHFFLCMYIRCRKCDKKMLNTKKNRSCSYTEKYMFFDYEAQQETRTHIANKIIAHDFEGNKIMFDTNEEFCEHIIAKDYMNYTFIAHYVKGYDSQFILRYLVDNTLKPFTIYNGTKLMLLEIKNLKIKIIDSSNFIHGPLRSFPKTFGLKELKKGYFPNFFNTVENKNYIGILPDKEYYGYKTMKTENKQEFEKWYNDKINENYIFNLKEELEAYCTSDVNIERRGCLELRKQFLEIAKIKRKKNYSKQSITWLKHFNNINIYHALNDGKKIIAGSKVDGYDEKSKTVYQYHGCFWHGCTKCYKDGETINNINHETMDDLYQKTIDRSTSIKNAGYNLVEQWECDWLKSNIYKKMEKYDISEPINPRDAFIGGRTNATKLRVKNKKNAIY
ncbi:hypothetical protein AGLY_014623 [Aphis glycines]|uniref:DNA-directed DNA polymerase n=1 Tax=Aphis glycines TaxID=307491 RepID=A0A6G0T1R5_APHGL|nr:hypothetical protein AGLY_014623 [Aphis glycines]